MHMTIQKVQWVPVNIIPFNRARLLNIIKSLDTKQFNILVVL